VVRVGGHRDWAACTQVQPQALFGGRALRPLLNRPSNGQSGTTREYSPTCRLDFTTQEGRTHLREGQSPGVARAMDGVSPNECKRSERSLMESLTGFAIRSCFCLQSLVRSGSNRRQFASCPSWQGPGSAGNESCRGWVGVASVFLLFLARAPLSKRVPVHLLHYISTS
jgi:hypothetical protein